MKQHSNDPVLPRLREIGELLNRGEVDKAEAAGLNLLQAYPRRPDVHNILGVVYLRNKRHRAAPHFEFACKAEPQNVVYLNNLGRYYLDQKLVELAYPFLHNALTIHPNLPTTLMALGDYFTSIGNAERALPYFDRARGVVPDNATIKGAFATSLDSLGRKEEANRLYQELRRELPDDVVPLYRLAMNLPLEQVGQVTSDLEKASRSEALTLENRSLAHKALGFIREKEGRYTEAFVHFDTANCLQPLNFDIGTHKAWVDQVISIFTPDFFSKYAGIGSPSALPVLVVGMLRSGTTLTEQIIAAHGQAAGAGELTRIGLFASGLGLSPKKDINKFLPTLAARGAKGIREMGDNYVDLLRFHAPKASRVVDKLPLNFLTLGLVALLCPNAHVIHCTRNSVDTCLSCFQNPLSDDHSYARDLEHLGQFHREYSRLMDHWRKVLPLPIYELSYERLTSDFESEARKLIAFLGLPWDDACLKFHEAGSTVRTFSYQQVRNPIYKTSVDRWRRYERELQPLVKALGLA